MCKTAMAVTERTKQGGNTGFCTTTSTPSPSFLCKTGRSPALNTTQGPVGRWTGAQGAACPSSLFLPPPSQPLGFNKKKKHQFFQKRG